ncbi:hypothetical protein ASE86_09915 [Sphingomonas sp. Leaf33]|uniref:PilZ domain-containing protein n=1 Tax=Sphingomonas sp. Leaf33 TaxID=1736215 RepID=UPI0006F87D00|nr:PilZ domain-containing protein [Sphingomonas sp. Leaf33]KQN26416.1 hypothetical protein ASE86_09915 [Sphingomonas sp. Leaf33]
MDQGFSSQGSATADTGGAGRDGGRDSLLLVATLKVAAMALPVTVRIRNLSSGGLMAEYAGRADIGDVAEIDVRGIGPVRGRVAWIAEGRMGIAFDHEIDPKRARKPVAVPPPKVAAIKRAMF